MKIQFLSAMVATFVFTVLVTYNVGHASLRGIEQRSAGGCEGVVCSQLPENSPVFMQCCPSGSGKKVNSGSKTLEAEIDSLRNNLSPGNKKKLDAIMDRISTNNALSSLNCAIPKTGQDAAGKGTDRRGKGSFRPQSSEQQPSSSAVGNGR